MQCSEDTIAPISAGEFVAQQASGSTFRLLQANGHCPHMSAPEETIAVLQDYLASVSSGVVA